jgi:hypothetical protein
MSATGLRRLLRAAAAHDATPALKALLPLTAVGVEAPLSSPAAPPLVALCKSLLQAPVPGASTLLLRGVTDLLEANLKRGRRYERKMREEEQRSLRVKGNQAVGQGGGATGENLAWYHSRLTAALQRSAGSEPVRQARLQAAEGERRWWVNHAWAASGAGQQRPATGTSTASAAHSLPDNPVDILREMHAVGLMPPRRMVVHAISSLALSGEHGDLERALAVLFFMDMHTPHVACTNCVDALVSGALLTQPPSGGVERALDIAEALHTSSQLVPSTAVVNRLLEVAASRVTDEQSLQRCKNAMRRFAAARVPILADVSVALLSSAMRLNDRATAVWSCRQIRARGGSIPAQLLLDLLEWSVADGDASCVDFLTEELLRTDKALYLAALNNPSC